MKPCDFKLLKGRRSDKAASRFVHDLKRPGLGSVGLEPLVLAGGFSGTGGADQGGVLMGGGGGEPVRFPDEWKPPGKPVLGGSSRRLMIQGTEISRSPRHG